MRKGNPDAGFGLRRINSTVDGAAVSFPFEQFWASTRETIGWCRGWQIVFAWHDMAWHGIPMSLQMELTWSQMWIAMVILGVRKLFFVRVHCCPSLVVLLCSMSVVVSVPSMQHGLRWHEDCFGHMLGLGLVRGAPKDLGWKESVVHCRSWGQFE